MGLIAGFTVLYLPPVKMETIWGFFTWTFDLEIMPGFVYLFILGLVAVGVLGKWLENAKSW